LGQKSTFEFPFAVNAELAETFSTRLRSCRTSEPLYFPTADEQLFDWLHWPSEPQPSDTRGARSASRSVRRRCARARLEQILSEELFAPFA
jgi:hypothetical protein